jgi:hypothetical protein
MKEECLRRYLDARGGHDIMYLHIGLDRWIHLVQLFLYRLTTKGLRILARQYSIYLSRTRSPILKRRSNATGLGNPLKKERDRKLDLPPRPDSTSLVMPNVADYLQRSVAVGCIALSVSLS